MTTTPPSQITRSPQTPLTPLHGAAYDHEDSPRRTSARLRQRRALESAVQSQTESREMRSARTPRSPRVSRFEPQSPQRTPPSKRVNRRVQVLSPTSSPEFNTNTSKPIGLASSHNEVLSSSSTTINGGMLPTPVKTPNKNQKALNKSNVAARALFQDPVMTENVAPSPRRNRNHKRFNGFSLESFRAEDNDHSGVQIFTDSVDQIPEVDKDEDNPFIDHSRQSRSSQKVTGTTKRRKISDSKPLDPQVEDALRDDEGMVYVFRGKKVYRRFDDAGEEEEEIDAEDLGLLQHTANGERVVRPLKTLTRKSIRPTRLFQTEEQKRARELEKEEEATTDVDEVNTARDIRDNGSPDVRGKSSKSDSVTSEQITKKSPRKKISPFDGWRRVKPGSASSSSTAPPRGRKRTAPVDFEEPATSKR